MEAFCKEIRDFFYGEDSKIDQTRTNFLITTLVGKYVVHSEYTVNAAKHMCNEITQQSLSLIFSNPHFRHHDHIKREYMNSLIAIVNHVIFTDILDEITWNELRAELN